MGFQQINSNKNRTFVPRIKHSVMYDQIRGDIPFFMFYASVAMLSLIACCYLLFRRGNAFDPGISSSARLRRWTAAFFAASALSHLWNLPAFFQTSSDDVMLSYLVGGLLDCMTVGPLAIVILFVMMQDRRRPLWPVAVMVAPAVVVMIWSVVSRSDDFLQILYVYVVSLIIGLCIYMVREVRHYGRWLRDNYADLEHKEVWQTFVVLTVVLLGLGIYTFFVEGLAYECFIQVVYAMLVCYLLWRVETLSDLSNVSVEEANEDTVAIVHGENDLSLSMRSNIGSLLKLRCEDAQLYLQNDISLTELAKQIGTNRVYLSQHFAMQHTTYNAYINGLRIQHFINLYHEAASTHQSATVQQLACKSGFRSYGTFNGAFKQKMGMTATEWMHTVSE